VATVAELTDPYSNFMLNPLARGPTDVCRVCLTFTDGYDTCYRCAINPNSIDVVLPISYSVHFGQLHTVLAQYKRGRSSVACRLQIQLAAVLWRFLAEHEACLAPAAGVECFDVVTTVPSGSAERDEAHALRTMVASLVEPVRDRHERLLHRSDVPVKGHVVDAAKYSPSRALHGESVLLIDDTWTTGANAQSAAAALRAAGAASIAVVVIGRHIHAPYRDNAARLDALPQTFEWERCAMHGG